jgi:hypothetical protein
MTGAVDLATDEIRVILLDNDHAFDAAHTTYASVLGNELASAGNYDTGGQQLVGMSVTVGTTTKWNATDVTWVNGAFTAYHAVIYDVTNSNSLICSIDFAIAKTVLNEDFKIRWDNTSNAIITLATA